MTLIGSLKERWRIFRRRTKVSSVEHVASRRDLPAELGTRVFLVGEPAKWAVMECPCRCGDRLDVNLMKSRKPNWAVTVRNGKLTVRPSLWQPREKCGSHFIVTASRIIWVD